MRLILDLLSLAIIVFYVYVEHNQISLKDSDITSQVGDVGLPIIKDKTMKNINWHSLRTRVFIALTAITAGLSAIQGMTKYDAAILVVLPILMFCEHVLAGDSANP